MNPKVLILRTAGTNCDYETDYAFQLAGAETALIHISQLIAGKTELNEYQIMAIPGGFSYGDDIAAGILLANEMKHKLADRLTEFVDSGKLIIGICNGFQVLVRSGLLPRLDSEIEQQTTLAMNTSAKFECRWVHLETQESPCVFTRDLKSHVYLPVAHAEGRFTAPDGVLNSIESNKQVVFRYVSADGESPEYPDDPNGSDRHIAGICDATGRIFGMMPHPERFLTRFNHPRWTREKIPDEGDGLAIFRNAVDYARQSS
ncbi:phosphoribosylformylglycinamidine synthase I [Candidatus Poribacteria bacterium]|nr:phosphoribosylformylglycinamidine synthase I [Candidatus Poribacteria bacterium]